MVQDDEKKPQVRRLPNGEKRYDLFCQQCGIAIEGKTLKRKFCQACGEKKQKEGRQTYNPYSMRKEK